MAFTRFHDDPCRIQKYLEESSNVGKYILNVPGNGSSPDYFNDPYVKIQKWGANLSNNKTQIENDLLGLTRPLNRDSIKQNNHINYLNNNSLYNKKNYPVIDEEITHQSRVTHPAWTFREVHSENSVNNFNYLLMNPQENVCIPFHNNISSRIVEKDYYKINNPF
tara:strand:+ start:111 stop:605 length:495 start_codon:yes stop_codon:yes gene_type:complete